MAGNAHANRHGHRSDCKFCQNALAKLKALVIANPYFRLKTELRKQIGA